MSIYEREPTEQAAPDPAALSTWAKLFVETLATFIAIGVLGTVGMYVMAWLRDLYGRLFS